MCTHTQSCAPGLALSQALLGPQHTQHERHLPHCAHAAPAPAAPGPAPLLLAPVNVRIAAHTMLHTPYMVLAHTMLHTPAPFLLAPVNVSMLAHTLCAPNAHVQA